MDKVNLDFTGLRKPIEERMRNPFLSSFILSWIVLNWKAIYTLLTYSSICIHGNQAKSVVAAAYSYMTINTCFSFPLFSALFFTIAYPWLELQIIDIYSKLRSEQTQIKYKNLGKLLVPGKLLLESFENNKKNQEIIDAVTKTNISNQVEIENLTSNKNRLNFEIEDLKKDKSELNLYKSSLKEIFKNQTWRLIIGDERNPTIDDFIRFGDDRNILYKSGELFMEIFFHKYIDDSLTLLTKEVFTNKYKAHGLDTEELLELRYVIISLKNIKPSLYRGDYFLMPKNNIEKIKNHLDIKLILEDSDDHDNFIKEQKPKLN